MNPPIQTTDSIHTYDDALQFLDSLDVSAMKLGLDRTRKLLDTLDNPQDLLPMVHIAGTNGKGSVTAMLASILRFSGYRVGTFTSPHLIHVRERITINGNPILPDDFQHEVLALKTHLEALDWPRDDWPTYFEFLNVMAYQYFKHKGVDITVFETGLGGRMDSTNIVKQPNLTVITTIGMDHMQHLGDTLAKIAAEKAGILKPGVPLILGSNLPAEAEMVIRKRASELDAPIIPARGAELVIDERSTPQTGLLINQVEAGKQFRLSLLGAYQKDNLATVLACIQQLRQQGYDIEEADITEGLAHTRWPVRFQYFQEAHILLDGSHNQDGFQALSDSLNRYYKDSPAVWLISLRSNRDPALLLDVIRRFGLPLGIVVTQSHPIHLYHPAEDLAERVRDELQGQCPVLVAPTPTEGLSTLRMLQEEHGDPLSLGIVTGSLYTAGEVLHCLETAFNASTA